jgi:hypothetical protein
MTQDFKNFTVSPESPALDAFTITPSATALTVRPRALLIGVGGTITVTTWRGTSLTLTVTSGQILPLVVTHVTAATASGIVGLA